MTYTQRSNPPPHSRPKHQWRSFYIGKGFTWTMGRMAFFVHLLWLFIESDFLTFAIPNTAFGIFSAMASPVLTKTPAPALGVLIQRFPLVLGYNTMNLLVFDLANQRAASSVVEDCINKPWRPIPQGKITTTQTRRMMLVGIPVILAMNYMFGVWQQGIMIHILTWLYNDLQGGDEVFIRELIIAIAYGLFNSGSLAVAIGPEVPLGPLALAWISIISGVILTTMQIQDLKDQKGDKTRGRRTMALFIGERFSRVSIAFFICFWTLACSYFWNLGAVAFALITAIGSMVVLRLFLCAPNEHATTWRWWCFWHASLYALPVSALLQGL
nr:(-)-beta-trans-bergamotene synthase [Stachybotrys sp.]